MQNYPGNKGGQGIREFLFNYTPASSRYFSFFYGEGGFEQRPEFKNVDWIIAEKNPELQLKSSALELNKFNDYRSLVEQFDFTGQDFIFADPPYLHSTRKNGRDYYKFEFNFLDHVEFLNYIISIQAKVLITHPRSELYNTSLVGWNFYTLRYMSRNGWFDDGIYCNYNPADLALLTYNYLGGNRTERQQIKRQRNNIVSKINSLPLHEKLAIFKQLNVE